MNSLLVDTKTEEVKMPVLKPNAMRFIFCLQLLTNTSLLFGQTAKTPCTTNPVYRQFDFWIGELDVYAKNGKKAGDSRVELILDSCLILENWTSASNGYAGKSFNTYNATSHQWQQTWVDNAGGITEFLVGKPDGNKMVFQTNPFQFSTDTIAIRRLSFYNLSPGNVRQHGEISKDNGATWQTEYDLAYRRKKT